MLIVLALIGAAGAAIVEPSAQPGSDAAPADAEPDDVTAAPANPDDVTDEPGDAAPTPDASAVPTDPAAREAWLTRELTRAAAAPSLGGARRGAVIVDVTTGKTLFAHDPDGRYNLASNAKVFTAATALARLGPGFRWRTAVLAADGTFDRATGEIRGNVWLKGRGDPTLSVGGLDALADDLRALGVRSIRGTVVLDTSYFDAINEPPHFDEQQKERAGFRAPIASVAVNQNAITVIVEPAVGGAGAAQVTIRPEAPEYVRVIESNVLTVGSGRSRIRITSTARRDHLELKVTGQIRAGSGPSYTRRRIDDPTRFAHELVRRALERQGIRVGRKRVETGVPPDTAEVLAAYESPPLGDVVRALTKASNNFMAESVLKTIGAETRGTPGRATWEDGLAAVRSYAADTCQIGGALRLDNGSGLFAASDVTPAQMVQLLVCAHRDYRVGPDLASSLAILGVDGTLSRRLGGSPARGRVRAKTGTLDHVSTIAGYAAVDGGHVLAFAIFANDVATPALRHARAMQDAMLGALIAYLDAL